jgi:hypothetical protein
MRAPALFLLLLLSGHPPVDLAVMVERLPTNPERLRYRADLDIDSEGGHLQGIQRLGDRYLLSGSSEEESYLVILTPEEDRAEYVRLRAQPLSHAGGFQVNDGFLAIGIEDDDSRSRSVVEIYDVSSKLDLEGAPIATIDREGERERVTAGAVGIARFRDDVLIVVGNWDSRDLDFYVSRPPLKEVVLTATLTASELSRTGWTNPDWHSYQNLNLFAEGDSLYLLGTASSEGENIADLYAVEFSGGRVSGLRKLSSTRFDMPERLQFKWGAGAWRHPQGGLELAASEEDLRRGGEIMSFHAGP